MRSAVQILKMTVIGLFVLVAVANLYLLICRTIFGRQLPTFLGFTSAVVISGSMEPEINVDDMVLIRKARSYGAGDTVTYLGNRTPVTHRVVEVTENGYITQGDANNAADGEIPRERVVGKVFAVWPGMGKVVRLMQSPLGMLSLFGLCCIMLWPRGERKAQTPQTVNV